MNLVSNECSQMFVVSDECGLKLVWCEMNGLKWKRLMWMWSHMNRSQKKVISN